MLYDSGNEGMPSVPISPDGFLIMKDKRIGSGKVREREPYE